MDTEMNNLGIMPRSENRTAGPFASNALPARKGSRPKTIIRVIYLLSSGTRMVATIGRWSLAWFQSIERNTTTSDSSAFISAREFARVLLGAPTICMALPVECAHWAIVRGWAEPHYLRSFGLMPPGAVLVYTLKNREELAVCYSLFAEAYYFACKFGKEQ